MRQTSDANLEAALALRRNGNVSRMGEFAEKVRAACDQVSRVLPDSPEPQVRWGRMLRALMRHDEALAQQEIALGKDPGNGHARYERLVLVARLYQRRMTALGRIELADASRRLERAGLLAPGVRPSVRSWLELERADAEAVRLRALIESDLAAVETAPGRSPAAGALGAWVRRDPQAVERLQRAASPEFEELTEALASLHEEQGRPRDALRTWLAGAEGDRGYAPFWEGAAEAELRLALADVQSGADPAPAFARAAQLAGKALSVAPGRIESRLLEARILSELAASAPDPEAAFSAALSACDALVGGHPAVEEAWRVRGLCRSNLAVSRIVRGRDGSALLLESIADFDRALAGDDANEESWLGRGHARLARAIGLKQAGREEAEREYDLAVEDFAAAVRRRGASARLWNGLGNAQSNAGILAMESGSDRALTLLTSAVETLAKVAELDPADGEKWRARGGARVNLAILHAQIGRDPVALLADAVDDLSGAIDRNPRKAESWAWRGNARNLLAYHRTARGIDPRGEYARAVEDYAEAIRLNAALAEAHAGRGSTRINLGLFLRATGQDAAGTYRDAIADLSEAIRLAPADGQSWAVRGDARVNLSSCDPRGAASAVALREAIEDYGRALQLNARLAKAWAGRAAARMNLAMNLEREAGDDAEKTYDACLSDYRESIRLNPRELHARLGAVLALTNWGIHRSLSGGEFDALFEEALRQADQVLAVDAEAPWRGIAAGMRRSTGRSRCTTRVGTPRRDGAPPWRTSRRRRR
jgi:hypothetical protein